MIRFSKLTSAAALVGLIAGCTVLDRSAIRELKPDGAPFANALYSEYVALADLEWGESDYAHGALFYDKARRAAMGERVAPEGLAGTRPPASSLADIANARSRLLETLEEGAGRSAPLAAAKAQVMFDCWLKEREQGWRSWDIARCRTGFHRAMGQAQAALARRPRVLAMSGPGSDATSRATLGYYLFFAFDSAAIDSAAARTISDAATAAKALPKPRLLVSGYADRAGPERYNHALAERRADAARQALVARGIDASTVTATWFGEARPLIETADGMPAVQNRRVEITIIPDSATLWPSQRLARLQRR